MQTTEQRIQELLALPSGWYDGGQGEAVTPLAAEVANEIIVSMFANPNIYPTLDGGLSIEYRAVNIEVDKDGELTAYHYLEEL